MAKAKAEKAATIVIPAQLKKTVKAVQTVAREVEVPAAAPEVVVPAPAPAVALSAESAKAKVAPATRKVAAAPKTEAKPEPEGKVRKAKLVRDSFTMPEIEYAALGEIKKSCLKAGIEVKKSELLRAGVALLKRLDTAAVAEVLATLPSLKAGRPKKGK